MKHFLRHRRILAVLAGLALSLAAQADALSARGTSCHLPGYPQPLRCASVSVPLDYRQPGAQQLDLHVTIAPAFREAAAADPLFVLAGGPGQAASDILGLLDNTFRSVRATRDIIFIDQRGTGRSGKLDCESTRALEGKSEAEQDAVIAACLASLNKPFSAYTTDNAARDLDRVRQALGYRAINIWGASYGTRLAQAYARRFPAQVRAMILDGVASPEQIIFAWGRDAQAALDAVFARCAAERACKAAFPDLPARFQALLQRVKSGAVKLEYAHPRTAARTRLVLPADDFLQTIRSALYLANAGARLPFVIDSAYRDNWAPFLALMHASGDFTVGGTATGLLLAVTCAEDIPRLTPAIIAEETRASFLEGVEVRRFPHLCKHVNVPSIAWAAPSPIDAPVLLLSGALDPVTPPRRAEEAARSMRSAQHLVAPQLGHGVSFHGCAPKLLRSFLDRPGQPLDAQCLRQIAAPGFQLGPAGPQP